MESRDRVEETSGTREAQVEKETEEQSEAKDNAPKKIVEEAASDM